MSRKLFSHVLSDGEQEILDELGAANLLSDPSATVIAIHHNGAPEKTFIRGRGGVVVSNYSYDPLVRGSSPQDCRYFE